MMEEIECDVLIVGGGPAGCTCALYTARADHKVVMLDKNPAVGALAITSLIANYPGVKGDMSGAALLDEMREQAIEYGTDYRRAQVFMVDVEGERKVVYTPDACFKARALVLATGAMGRPPSFKGEDTYLGRGVSYCATCDGAFYRDSEVAVVGVNQEAIEEAQFLTKFAKTVHWITQADPKADDEHALALLECPQVKHWSQTRMLSIEGDASGVTGVHLKPRGEEEAQSLPVEGVFIYVAGSQPATEFLEGCVALKEDGGLKVDDEMATSVPGVFAIGDIRNTPFKQVVVAASDGCIAAMAIDRYLKGRKNVRVDWIHQ
jgi:thioredoxin reductase (NADPH)